MISLFLSLALAASNAPEAPSATSEPAPASTAKPEKPKRVCRTAKKTGSNFNRRICKTEAQWQSQSDAGMQTLDMVDQSYKANVGNGKVN